MISQLFINACILITFISVAYSFLKYKDISNNKSIPLKILVGSASGLLGIILMIFSLQVTPTIITDFRALPILMTAVYGGILAPIISSVIMGMFRIIFFGVSSASVVAVIVLLLMGIGFSAINLMKATRKIKWIYSVLYLIILNTFAMIFLIKESDLLIKIFIVYSTSTIVVSFFVYKYTEHLSESVVLHKKLENETLVDYLTGLNNFRKFDNTINKIAEENSLKKGRCLSLLFLDIDHFKEINDTYGHNFGNIVLKNLASILRNTCRSYDIISRNGGEEFSVILLDCPESHALEIAERIRKNVEAYEFNCDQGSVIKITISIGVSIYPNASNSLNKFLEQADNALYKAKRTGRNKVVLYRDGLQTNHL